MKWDPHQLALLVSLGLGLCLSSPVRASDNSARPVSVELGRPAADTEEKEAPEVRTDAEGLAAETVAAAAVLAQGAVGEIEPNGTVPTATPLSGPVAVGWGTIYPYNDIDLWSFAANAGERVFAATMTSSSAGGADSELALIASDGVTVLELDNDDGALGGSSSSIAGAVIPATGTYYLKVRYPGTGTTNSSAIRPYHLHFAVRSGLPTAEIEANDSPATADPVPANGLISGAHGIATDADYFRIALNAGDTVYVGLDADPERDGTTWNPRIGFGLFGDAGNQILVIDDGSVTSPNSEAMFLTAKAAGTYYAYVDTTAQTSGAATQTYLLSVAVHPFTAQGAGCTTYVSTDVPKTIPAAGGLVSSTLTVPGHPRIADLDVSIQLNHLVMWEIDAHLRSPAGNNNGLFTDVGATAAGGQTQMDLTLDDEAAWPIGFWTIMKGVTVQPESSYRLWWFDGEDAGGTWTLDLYDDANNISGGTLTGWSITVCEPAPVTCPGVVATLYSQDFEAGTGGFIHSGAADSWAWGLPSGASAPILGCGGGTNCWKTNLTGTYGASSNCDLLSPRSICPP